MSLPKTPEGWACRLATLVYAVKDAHQLDRLPVDVREVAMDFSREAFPEAPITEITGVKDSQGFEGMLLPIPGRKGEWGIIYNDTSKSEGRTNFSIAHELGHYLLHRVKFPSGKRCSNRDMMDWNSEEAQIEGEANRFAAGILMPLDDFRTELQRKSIDLHLFADLAERYKVSLTAAILRWLGFTDQRAMIVVGKDGYIDWAWSSKSLLRSGVFYRARQETVELPPSSLAAQRDDSHDGKSGILHPPGVWVGDEQVTEMTVSTEEYGNMTISVLIYPKIHECAFDDADEVEEDVVDRFARRMR